MLRRDSRDPDLPEEDGDVGGPSRPPRRSVSGCLRAVCLAGAGLFLLLGAIGAALPGLPTTPFLLLASFFLVRASPRLNQRLLRSRFFGPILRDWQEHGGVRRDVKLQAVAAVVLAVGATLIFGGLSVVWQGVVFAFAALGIVVILKLPTLRVP